MLPGNKEIEKLHHEAFIGLQESELEDIGRKLEKNRKEQRTAIDRLKLRPEGMDDRGIKPYKIPVDVTDEEIIIVEEKKSEIETALDSPVSLEFEGEHINNIVYYS